MDNKHHSYFLLKDISDFLNDYHPKNPFFYLSADSGFIKDKKHTIDVWIAEHNLVAIASGLALKGNKVIINAISSFLLENSYLVLKNVVSYYNLDLIMIGVWSGIAYSKMWHTHHNLDDIWYINLLPNIKILLPADSNELLQAIKYAYKSGGAYYIRIWWFRGDNFSLPFTGDFVDFKKKIFGDDKNILIISYWQLLHEVTVVQRKLEAEWIKSSIMNFNSMNNFSVNKLQKTLSTYKHIFVIEDHFENSGVWNRLITNGIKNVFIKWIKKEHIDISWDIDFLKDKLWINKDHIASFIKRTIKHD